ncbi:hypothetical protein Nepgr_033096 [Nepenthes gracilis]|uniref:Uncharacterized protein n=1 Tax=Nepenthes gracilis TaxID=150966 RepID=A0AAD3TLP1_NEPGR|nr:hypothetical protein Nepgr_033096 [Nepenthes gracilis]
MVGRYTPSRARLALEARYWDGIRLCRRIVSLVAHHIPEGILHPGNAGIDEASRLKDFPEEAGFVSRRLGTWEAPKPDALTAWVVGAKPVGWTAWVLCPSLRLAASGLSSMGLSLRGGRRHRGAEPIMRKAAPVPLGRSGRVPGRSTWTPALGQGPILRTDACPPDLGAV